MHLPYLISGPLLAVSALVSSTSLLAATATPAVAPVSGWTSMLQVIGGLLLVALLLAASLYLLKRLANPQGLGRNPLQVISATSVGPRERVVVVEIADTWLVLGVTTNQISRLHELPRPAQPADTLAATPRDTSSFASRLRQIVEHRHGR